MAAAPRSNFTRTVEMLSCPSEGRVGRCGGIVQDEGCPAVWHRKTNPLITWGNNVAAHGALRRQ